MKQGDCPALTFHRPVDQNHLRIGGKVWLPVFEAPVKPDFPIAAEGQALAVKKIDPRVDMRKGDLSGFAETAHCHLVHQPTQYLPVLSVFLWRRVGSPIEKVWRHDLH